MGRLTSQRILVVDISEVNGLYSGFGLMFTKIVHNFQVQRSTEALGVSVLTKSLGSCVVAGGSQPLDSCRM